MKQICKNCANSRPTYKGRYCVADSKKKMVKLSGTCDKWREKRQ